MSSSAPPPRCFMHNLVAADDGRCTLCRRGEPPAPSGEGRVLYVGGVILSLLVAGAIVYKGASGYLRVLEERSAAAPTAVEADAETATAPRANVRLYTTPWCPHCKRAKQWLSAQRIEFDEIDLEKQPMERLAHRKVSPKGSVPTLDAGGEVVVGFDPDEFRAALQRARRKAP